MIAFFQQEYAYFPGNAWHFRSFPAARHNLELCSSYERSDPSMLQLLITTTLAGVVGTGLGGVVGALFRKDSSKTISLLLSFAGGVMISIVCFDLVREAIAVSYTHLDVYKRQRSTPCCRAEAPRAVKRSASGAPRKRSS